MLLFERIIGLIAPHECLGCGREGHLLCAGCAGVLPPAPGGQQPSGVKTMWPGVIYDGWAKEVVHALKFERASAAANDIARCIAAGLPHHNMWVVTHVPTAAARVRQRGYDQSRLIARLVAARIGAPYMPLLTRVTGVRQVGSTRAERRQQMRNAFRPIHIQALQKQHVLLIDDVLTTGATIESAAAVLRTAGAAHVSAATFASAPLGASKKHLGLV